MAGTMSSGPALFSSPPLAPGMQYDCLRTPQQTYSVKTATFAPATPSPLRSSRNANLMPNTRKDHGNEGVENLDLYSPYETSMPKTPFAVNTSTSETPSTAISTPSFFLNSCTSSIPSATSQSSRATSFQFQARARSSSPSVQLHNHTTSNRESRKRLFLDRLRNKRDDERSERSGEQVMRMDWVREQKARESELARRSNVEAGMVMDYEIDEPYDESLLEEEMSPTEEREIEELVSYLEAQPRRSDAQEDDFSDEDYDALFTEVMSQETFDHSGMESFHRAKGANSLPQTTSQNEMDMDLS